MQRYQSVLFRQKFSFHKLFLLIPVFFFAFCFSVLSPEAVYAVSFPPDNVATISATKIVCDSENLLPDWADGDADITVDTAENFLASTPERSEGCRVVTGWNFQWGPESSADAGGSYIGAALAPWVTFGPTNDNGIATAQVPLANVGSKIWVREQLKNGFLGFSFDGDNDNTLSAEIYCAGDVLNYDNYDYIASPVSGETYHCVAFNVRVQEPIENTCLTPNSLGDTSKFELGVSPEPQLASIFTNAGFSIDPQSDQINTQVWDIDPNSISTTFDVTLLAKYAGNRQVFGYYKKGDTSTFVPLFRVGTPVNPVHAALPELSINATTSVTIYAPITSVGFAIDTEGNNPARYYSQTNLNSDGKDHVAVYNSASNEYILAFEDLPGSSWDKDHNDLVVKLSQVTCEECEPQDGEIVSGTQTRVTSIQVGEEAPVMQNASSTIVTSTSITDQFWSADDAPSPFGSAQWIWSEDPIEDWTVDKRVTFEETFTVTGSALNAQLVVAADNSYDAYVNGALVGQVATDNGHVAPAETYAVTLTPGLNTLKIVAKNWAQEGEALNNPAGLIYKLTWTVRCEGGEEDPKKAKVHVRKYIGEEPAKNQELEEGTEFNLDVVGAPTGNFILNEENDFTFMSNEVSVGMTQVTVSERTSVTDPDDETVLPIGAECVPGKYRLNGYKTSTKSFADAETKTLETNASWTANVQAHTYVIVQNEYCPMPQVASVMVCKVEGETPLPGWTMVLLGNKVQDDLSVPTNGMNGADSLPLTLGKSYVAHALGTWTNQNGNNPADAEYSQPNATGSWVDMYPGFVSDVLELRIANQFGNWGAYNSNHSYWRSFTPSVDGAVTFSVFDGENGVQDPTWYGDNIGNLNVDIYEGYAGITGENGCVTFTDVPYGSYTLDEQLQDGWIKVSGTGPVTIDSENESFTVVNTDEEICTENCGGSGETVSFATTTVYSADLATSTQDVISNITKWLFYNDKTGSIDGVEGINNSIGSFVTGPTGVVLGTGSVQISAPNEPTCDDVPSSDTCARRNLATYQFGNVKLSDMKTLRFSTYSQSVGNGSPLSERSPYLHFNVSFNGLDTWQSRLVYVPATNGTVVNDTWQNWDAIDSGNALWVYSGAVWPVTGEPGSTPKTWNQILVDYPQVKILASNSFFGFRVGEPYADGFTGNVDNVVVGIKTGTNTHTHTYDFEPTVITDEDCEGDCGGGSPGPTVTTSSRGGGGGGNWGPYLTSLVAGATDDAPEVLGATDELPGLPNTGNAPLKTNGSEALFVYGALVLFGILGNVFLLRKKEV